MASIHTTTPQGRHVCSFHRSKYIHVEGWGRLCKHEKKCEREESFCRQEGSSKQNSDQGEPERGLHPLWTQKVITQLGGFPLLCANVTHPQNHHKRSVFVACCTYEETPRGRTYLIPHGCMASQLGFKLGNIQSCVYCCCCILQ